MVDAPTTETIRLLPCPFCGGADIRTYTHGEHTFSQCHDCTSCGPDQKGQRHWNTRSSAGASVELVHDVISDSVNLANAKRRAHEWKLHIAARKGHMPFEEVGAYLLDEIIRLENLVFARQKNLDSGRPSGEPGVDPEKMEVPRCPRCLRIARTNLMGGLTCDTCGSSVPSPLTKVGE